MKRIFWFIAALMLIPTAVFAEGITVLYNGLPMNFKDVAPEIINDRVMLPFRSVFEQLGAEVDYYDESRTVEADVSGRKIHFSLDGSEIYSEDGELIYVMDVPPVVKEGRTLVPVRAVSEAAGLEVGWDSGERTVVITDENAIIEEIHRLCPSLNGLKTVLDTKDNFFVKKESGVLKINGEEIKLEGKTNADSINRSSSMTVELMGEKCSFELIVTAESLYFKTDLAEKCPELFSETIHKSIPAEKWMRADWSELEEYISGRDGGELKQAAAELLGGSPASQYIDIIIDAAIENIDTDSAASARQIPANINAIAEMFGEKSLSVKNENGDTVVNLVFSEGMENVNLSYSGRYDSVGELESTAVIELNTEKGKIEIQTKTQRDSEAVVEKVLLPKESVNFVDVLHTIIMDNNFM